MNFFTTSGTIKESTHNCSKPHCGCSLITSFAPPELFPWPLPLEGCLYPLDSEPPPPDVDILVWSCFFFVAVPVATVEMPP